MTLTDIFLKTSVQVFYFVSQRHGLVKRLDWLELALDMLSQTQQNSTNPWFGQAFGLT